MHNPYLYVVIALIVALVAVGAYLEILINLLNTVNTILSGRLILWSNVPGYPRLVHGKLQVTPNEQNTVGIIAIPVKVFQNLVSLTINGAESGIIGNNTAILIILAPYGSLSLRNTTITTGTGAVLKALMPSNVTYLAIYQYYILVNSSSGSLYSLYNEVACYLPVKSQSNLYPVTLIISSTNYEMGMGCGESSNTQSPTINPGMYWLIIEFINGPNSYISHNYVASINYNTEGWSFSIRFTQSIFQ